MNVLLSAYACMPDHGSEPGFGWNWAMRLAERGLNVTVLTRGHGRETIEKYLLDHPMPNLRFEYFDVPTKLFMSGRGMHYILWQSMAVKAAKAAHAKYHFDLVHHVTYGSIHVPTQLWRLGVPTVFGPIGGGQTAPPSMLEYFGTDRTHEQLRTLFTKVIRRSPFHRKWFSKISTIFAANSDTLEMLQDMGKSDAKMEYDVGVPTDYLSQEPKQYAANGGPIRLIWVARMLPRKALPLALDALARTTSGATLTIVGNGLPEPVVRGMIAQRGLSDRVFWAGRRLTVDEVRAAYQEHDAMLFTSVRETCGVQLLEAMAVGLPVITLDLHGAKSLIPDNGGIKVPVTTVAEVVSRMAEAIDRFSAMSVDEKNAMSRISWELAKTCTWTSRAAKAESLYRSLVVPPVNT